MDSKRRHELSQNYLANWLFDQYEEWIRPNSQIIGWLAVTVLVLVAGFLSYGRVVQWNKAAAWRQYYQAVSSENQVVALEAISEVSTGEIGDQARLTLAQVLCSNGCDGLSSDSAKAIETLEKAIGFFGKVRDESTSEEFKRQALWGIAQSKEAMASVREAGDLDEAIQTYKAIEEKWPNDYWGKRAAKEIEYLSRADTKRFFELSVKAAKDKPKADDFKVDIDKNDPFKNGPGNFDSGQALGETSILGGDFFQIDAEAKEAKQKEDKQQETEQKTEDEPKEPETKEGE